MEAIDYTAIRFWFDFLQTLFVVGITIYVWLNRRHSATREQIAKVEARAEQSIEALKTSHDQRLDAVETRATKIEGELAHAPSHADIKQLNTKLAALHGDLQQVIGQMRSIDRLVGLINEFFINNNRGKG